LARSLGDESAEIANLNLLTAFLIKQGQFKKLPPYLQRGLEVATANEDWEWQLTMQERLGFTHYQLGQLPEAQAAYKAALETAMQLQAPEAAAHLYGRLGAVLAEQDQMADATKAATQALKLGQEQENWALVGEQQVLLAFASVEQDDVAQAIDYCQQAIATFQQTGDDDQLTKAKVLLAELKQLASHVY
jgi:tetratricopeptide (TPR) repeat protein